MNRRFKQLVASVIAAVVMVELLEANLAVSASVHPESAVIGNDSIQAPVTLIGAQYPDLSIDQVGHLGGEAQSIQVVGDYAYVGFGPEFAILDVSNPSHIQRVGWVVAAGEVADIAINGDLAYIAYGGLTSPTGLQVIRISHPTIPVIIATLELRASGCSPLVVIKGSSAYVAYEVCDHFPVINCGTVLHRLDISNPAKPVKLDTYIYDCSSGYGHISDIDATDIWLYSLWWISGSTYLKIFDISTPTSLVETATYDIGPGGGTGIAISGVYAFIAAGPAGLKVVDISDPLNPATAITHTLPGSALGVLINGTTAYITLDNAIMVLDVMDPFNPVYLGSYPTAGQSMDLFVDSSIAYSANGWDGVEIFEPATVSQLGVIEYPQHPNDYAYIDPFAYAAADDGLWVLDISNPRMPFPVAHMETPFPAVSLVLLERYPYTYAIIALSGDGLWIIDVTNPLLPTLADVYSLPIDIRQMMIDGNRLYIAAGLNGLYILDPTDPLNLTELGAYIPSYSINAVAVAGIHAYLATNNGTFRVLDISSPQAIDEVGVYDHSDDFPECSSANTVAVQGHIVYHGGSCGGPTPLAGITGRIRLIDVSDPENPFEAGILPELSIPTWISLDANRAYGKSYHDGLKIYDISNPAAPQAIGSYTPPAGLFDDLYDPFGVTPTDKNIFLYGKSTFILQYTDPALPSIGGSITHANHQPYPGVPVSLGDPLLDQVSDMHGAYIFGGLVDRSYTLTPSLPGYVFSPPSRTVSVPPSAFSQNFTILPEPVQIDFTPGISTTLGYTDTQGLPTWLDIPGSASTTPLTLQIVPAAADSSPGYYFTGHAFELYVSTPAEGATGMLFDAPLTINIRYSPQDIAVINDTTGLVLWWWDGAAWQDAAQSCSPASEYSRDPDNDTLSIPICQTGIYKLVGPTNQVYLPAISY